MSAATASTSRTRRRYLLAVAAGVLLVFVARWAVNRTVVADWAIAPLLVPDTAGPADAIVVPGAGVVDDCAPNLNGVRRVLLARRLWQQGRAPLLVFSGGTGNGTCPVAVAMARLAVELGVPESQVRIETASRSTHENADVSAPLLRGWGVRRVLVVTDRLHMRRAAGVFSALGFDVRHASVSIPLGHADNVDMLWMGVREFAALAYYRARGWLGDGITAESASAANRAAPARTTGTREPVEPSEVRNPAGPIVILGASYAEGWPLARVGGYTVINRGIGGQTSSDMLGRFESDVVAAAPRAVLVWGFINDVFRARDIEATLAGVRENYTAMIHAARANGIEPVIGLEVTMGPRAGALEALAALVGPMLGKRPYQDGVNAHVRATNASLAAMAAREGVLVLDLPSALADGRGRRRRAFTQPDGSHITTAGYDMLTSYSGPILEAHFVGRQRGI